MLSLRTFKTLFVGVSIILFCNKLLAKGQKKLMMVSITDITVPARTILIVEAGIVMQTSDIFLLY